MKTNCHRCGHPIEGGSTVAVTAGPLRARIRGPVKLCACCSQALLDWLNHGDPAASSIRSPRAPDRPATRRSASWAMHLPHAAAAAF
jgi:hypothetical protein